MKSKNGDFAAFLKILYANYKTDFSQEGTGNFITAELIFKKVISLGWSRDRFIAHLEDFISRYEFATFNFSNFFKSSKEIKLKNYNQLLDEINKSPSIQGQIDRFLFLNSSKTGLSTYWVEKGVLSDYQKRVLLEKSKQHKSWLEKKQEENAESQSAKQAGALNPSKPILQLSDGDSNAAIIAGLKRDNEFLLSELGNIRRLVLTHSEHAETLKNAALKMGERVKSYYDSREKTAFQDLKPVPTLRSAI